LDVVAADATVPLQGARQLHEQALTGYRWVLGDEHPNTIQSINYLAAVRRELEEL
jgi:hypothetical protein